MRDCCIAFALQQSLIIALIGFTPHDALARERPSPPCAKGGRLGGSRAGGDCNRWRFGRKLEQDDKAIPQSASLTAPFTQAEPSPPGSSLYWGEPLPSESLNYKSKILELATYYRSTLLVSFRVARLFQQGLSGFVDIARAHGENHVPGPGLLPQK